MVVSNCWTLLCWAFRIFLGSAFVARAPTTEQPNSLDVVRTLVSELLVAWCEHCDEQNYLTIQWRLDPFPMMTISLVKTARRAGNLWFCWCTTYDDQNPFICRLLLKDNIPAANQRTSTKSSRSQLEKIPCQPFAVDIPHIILSTKLLLCMSFKTHKLIATHNFPEGTNCQFETSVTHISIATSITAAEMKNRKYVPSFYHTRMKWRIVLTNSPDNWRIFLWIFLWIATNY